MSHLALMGFLWLSTRDLSPCENAEILPIGFAGDDALKPLQPVNTINLENPIEYNCRIENYTSAHGEMLINVRHQSDHTKNFFIVFSYVSAFSGLMQWKGVNLVIPIEQEQLRFMRPIITSLTDKQILESRHLYMFESDMFESENQVTRIVANRFQLFENPY